MRTLVVMAWTLGAIGAVAGLAGAQPKPATQLAAHRGGALLWPENSLLAFRNAVALRADYIEFDVHLSKDGEVVVIHDPTLDRTTSGSGAVKDRTVAELKALRLKDRAGALTDETVPTLDEVAAVAAQGRRRMLLEITVVDAATVAQAHKAGIQVGAWTANDAPAMKRLIDAGVDVLITDQPDAAKALLGR